MRKRNEALTQKEMEALTAIMLLTEKEGKPYTTAREVKDFFPDLTISQTSTYLQQLLRKGVLSNEVIKTGGHRFFRYFLNSDQAQEAISKTIALESKLEKEEPEIPRQKVATQQALIPVRVDVKTPPEPEKDRTRLMAECPVCAILIPLKAQKFLTIVKCHECNVEFLQRNSVLQKLENDLIPIKIWTCSGRVWGGVTDA